MKTMKDDGDVTGMSVNRLTRGKIHLVFISTYQQCFNAQVYTIMISMFSNVSLYLFVFSAVSKMIPGYSLSC